MRKSRGCIRQTVLVELESSSCSGIIIDTSVGYIVTHASLLTPFLANKTDVYKQLAKHGNLDCNAFDIPAVRITYEVDIPSVSSGDCYTAAMINVSLSDTSSSRIIGDTLAHCTGAVSKVWRSNDFAKTIATLFRASEWKFWEDPVDLEQPRNENRKQSKDFSAECVLALLPCFVLICVGDALKQFDTQKLTAIDDFMLDVGNIVYVVGTPFGSLSPAVFLNSVSKGIISNVAGTQRQLILTDARCIPGTEGGAVYMNCWKKSLPFGMVVAPLCWKMNEWIGLSLICRLSCILWSLTDTFHDIDVVQGTLDKHEAQLKSVADGIPVVLIHAPDGSWGSGIIIDELKSLVLTCSHVVKTYREVTVQLSMPDIVKYKADVIWASKAGHVYDLALIMIQDFKPQPKWLSRVSVEKPHEGDEVLVVGHAAWGIHYNMRASVTTGVISRVVYHKTSPVLIQTSCTVNAGASGGALISTSGHLLGIVVCNARDTINGACYPHINLCVPSVAVWPTIESYFSSNQTECLQSLTTSDNALRQLWTVGSDTGSSCRHLQSRL